MSDLTTYRETGTAAREADADARHEAPADPTGPPDDDRLPLPARRFRITDMQQWIDLCA